MTTSSPAGSTPRFDANIPHADANLWQEIAAAWLRQDGQCFGGRLDLLPCNEADILTCHAALKDGSAH